MAPNITEREREHGGDLTKIESNSSTSAAKVNGSSASRQGRADDEQDAESDVDELVDSDADDAPNGGASAGGGAGRVGRPRGSKSSKRASGNANVRNGASQHARQRSDVDTKLRSDGISSKGGKEESASRPSSKPASRRASPARGVPVALEPVPPLPADAAKSYGAPGPGPSSSREMLGRTATGGPVPYYYPQSHIADSNKSNNSPHQAAYNNVKPAAIPAKTAAALQSDISESEPVDLTGQEVDKFLDLIEKFNLDTSNEDDMARSVTELYQEWLEWCAKRNVVSTKSKQALVGEFVRIHHGAYGPMRQQRAMDIVQGSRTFHSAGSANAALDRAANGASSSRAAQRGGVVARDVDRRIRPVHLDKNDSPPRRVTGQRISPPLSSSAPQRPLTPGYDNAFARSIPPAIIDSIHQQIREDVLREANGMVQQLMRENLTDYAAIAAENQALARRVEQLELHSDNLAQWVQHLNRVQEEIAIDAAQGTAPLRGEALNDPRAYHHGQGHRDFGPSGGPGPDYRHGSPKRGYGGTAGLRGSMSPAVSHRSAGHAAGPPGPHLGPPHDIYDRHGGPPVPMGMAGHPPPGGIPGPPPPASQHSGSFRGDSPRIAHVYGSGGHAGPMGPPYAGEAMMGGPPPPPGADGRGYYSGGPAYDERRGPPPPPPPSHAYDQGSLMHANRPPSPPASSNARQMKRARNGY